jgi:hypothetical protein
MKTAVRLSAVVVLSAAVAHGDDMAQVSFVRNVIVDEGDTARFGVRVTWPAGSSPSSVDVGWATEALTAASGGDFVPSAGILSFARNNAGTETVQEIAVPTVADSGLEASETFLMRLTSVSAGAVITDAVAHGVIREFRVPGRCPIEPGGLAPILVQYPGSSDDTTHGGKHDTWGVDGTIVLSRIELADSDWEIEAAGDFDGDGTCNFLWGTHDDPAGQLAVTVLDQIPDAPNGPPPLFKDARPGKGWRVVGAADVNGDAVSDVVWSSPDGAVFQLRLGVPGGGRFDEGTIKVASPGGQPVGLIRSFLYGGFDILWQKATPYETALMCSPLAWLGDELRAGNAEPTVSLPAKASILALGDFDGDGRDDAFVSEPKDGGLVQRRVWFLEERSLRGRSDITSDFVNVENGSVVGPH